MKKLLIILTALLLLPSFASANQKRYPHNRKATVQCKLAKKHTAHNLYNCQIPSELKGSGQGRVKKTEVVRKGQKYVIYLHHIRGRKISRLYVHQFHKRAFLEGKQDIQEGNIKVTITWGADAVKQCQKECKEDNKGKQNDIDKCVSGCGNQSFETAIDW